jgi:hypothetical protein
MTVQDGAGSAGFWEFDEPLPGLRRRVVRALAVAGVWGLSALPTLVGGPSCAVASLLHRPCPGCGMTRALRLLVAGQVDASLRMHPLAVPVLVAGLMLVAASVWATLQLGSPLRLHRTRFGRVALAAGVVTYGATLALWVLRWFGLFGGPVPVH